MRQTNKIFGIYGALLVLLTEWMVRAQSSLTVSLTTTTINANSAYSFNIGDTNLRNYSGTITLGFPAGKYSLSGIRCYNTLTPSTTYTCSVTGGGSSVAVPYSLVTFANSFIYISVADVKNPSSKQSLDFTYTFSQGATTYSSAIHTMNSLSPDSLVACSVSFTPATVNTEATASFNLTIKNALDTNGGITISFPSTWTNSVSSSYPPINYTSTTCAPVSGLLKTSFPCDILGQVIQASQVISAAAAANSILVFTATRIRSPPTTFSGNTVTISTQTSAGNQVDSSPCAVNAVSPQTLSLTTTSIFVIGLSSSLSLVWFTDSPLKTGDVLTLTLPINYMEFTFFDRAQIVYNSNRLAIPSFSNGASTVQYRYTISSLSNPDSEISTGLKVELSNVIVSCLVDISPRVVALLISRSGNNIASGSLTITPVPNTLTSVVLSSVVSIVSSPLTLNVTFNTTNSLAVRSRVRIQIPSSITLTGTAPSCLVSSSTAPSAIMSTSSCSNNGTYTIIVDSFLQSTLPAGSFLTIIISNALRNPETTEPTSPFIISTFSEADFAIDRNSAITYTATPGTIGNISITPTTFVVVDPNIYTLDYTALRTIKSGSTISVRLPTEIALSTSPSFSYSLNNAAFITISPAISTVSGITMLTFSGIINAQLTVGTNIKIRFNRLLNPPSLATSGSFLVDVGYNGYPIESLSTGLTVTMTTMADFREVTPVLASKVNGATKDYTFYLRPTVAIATGSTISIQILDNTGGTNQLSYPTSVSCPMTYNGISISTTCTVSGSILNIVVGGTLSDITSTTSYILVVSSVILARVPKTSSNFRVTSMTAGGFGVQTRTVSSIVNTEPNNIVSIALSILSTPSRLNQKQQLRFTIKTFNGLNLLANEYLVLEIPASFTYLTTSATSLCTTAAFTCTLFNSNTNTIKIMASASYPTTGLTTDFAFTLNDQIYVSPTTFDFSNDFFLVTTFTSDGLVIDDTDVIAVPASKATFFRTCGGKCETCSSSNTSICLTCYVAGTGQLPNITYGGFSMLTSDSQCVDRCGAGYYSSGGSCNLCVSPCRNCLSATQCQSCATNFYYVASNPANNRCVGTCPTGTYASTSTNTCQTCASSCFTCTTLSSQCTACTGTLYLSGTNCVASCPDGTYENSTLNACLACDAGCQSTCGVSATDCLACKTGYFKVSPTSTQCVNSCPTGTVKNTLTSTCECSSTCQTCSGTLTNCTSCPTGKIYYANTCIPSCPASTYQSTPTITTSTTCINCLDTRCMVCNSTDCLTCSSGAYLYAGSCYTTCPEGTRLEGNACELCPNGCKTCLTTTNCTSCFNGFLVEGASCVTTCSPGKINFNATSCLSSCPLGYYNNSNRCEINPSNNTVPSNNTTTQNITQNATQSIGRIIPFPYTIAYVIVVGVSIGMRCLYPSTLLPSVMMSLGSVLEVMSVITLIIVSFMELNALVAGLAILIVILVMIYISNVIALILIIKVLHNDNKFMTNYRKKPCPNIVIRILSVMCYHKFHQIVFSNIFGVKVFCNKVDFVRRLYPFNVLLIISLFLSVGAVVGASLVSYQVQSSLLSSSTFIQSVDSIVIIVLNAIPTILVLRRQDTVYEQDINDKEAKRYETQDQLNMNNESVGIEDVFIEESGDAYGKPAKVGNSRKSYFYQNSKRSQSGEDPYEGPLDRKRLSNTNPIAADNANGQKSSESLFFGDRSKLKSQVINPMEEVSQEVQQIMLEEPVRDNLMPNLAGKNSNAKNGKDPKDPMLNYTGYDLDSALLQLNQNSDEFKKLPSDVKAKIRLAKANIQINNNSKNLNNVSNGRALQNDVQEIQLSPKRNRDDLRRGSLQEDANVGSQSELLNDSLRKSENQSSPKLKKSKSKSKSKSKQKKGSKSKEKRYNDANKPQKQSKQQMQQARLLRNQSEQISKKQLVAGVKTTKSQNIKKKKKKPNNEIKVVYNGNQNNTSEEQKNELNNGDEKGDDREYEEDEPTLPVFKHRSKSKGKRENKIFDSQSDGLESADKGENGKLSGRSENLEDNIKNLRAIRGQRTIPNQNPDDLPQLHSSQQLNNLVIVNKEKKKRPELEFSNDDSSIYKKIYNDDTETLKSVQGDNLFGQEISPSQFNIQNQRFQDSSVSNDMPIPATFQDLDEDEKGRGDDDPIDEFGSHMKRYESSHNIDYDSVLSKRLNNDRIKQLEKIYLPRLEVVKPRKKKK